MLIFEKKVVPYSWDWTHDLLSCKLSICDLGGDWDVVTAVVYDRNVAQLFSKLSLHQCHQRALKDR